MISALFSYLHTPFSGNRIPAQIKHTLYSVTRTTKPSGRGPQQLLVALTRRGSRNAPMSAFVLTKQQECRRLLLEMTDAVLAIAAYNLLHTDIVTLAVDRSQHHGAYGPSLNSPKRATSQPPPRQVRQPVCRTPIPREPASISPSPRRVKPVREFQKRQLPRCCYCTEQHWY